VSRVEGTTRMYYFKKSPVSDALRKFLRATTDKGGVPDATGNAREVREFYTTIKRPLRHGLSGQRWSGLFQTKIN